LDFRLHQFVRVIEAFIAPPFGKSAAHFADRLCEFTCERAWDGLRELYTIRSAIEHLRGPYDGMTSRPRGGRHKRLLRRCIESETLARVLLFEYFTTENAWPHFKSRQSVESFWALDAAERRRILMARVPMQKLARSIDYSELDAQRGR
jgi:hypothetical protein